MLNKLQRTVTYKAPILGSSYNGEQIAATVKGLLIALVPIIIGLGKFYEVQIAEGDVMTAIQAIGVIISAGVTLFGIARKINIKMG